MLPPTMGHAQAQIILHIHCFCRFLHLPLGGEDPHPTMLLTVKLWFLLQHGKTRKPIIMQRTKNAHNLCHYSETKSSTNLQKWPIQEISSYVKMLLLSQLKQLFRNRNLYKPRLNHCQKIIWCTTPCNKSRASL